MKTRMRRFETFNEPVRYCEESEAMRISLGIIAGISGLGLIVSTFFFEVVITAEIFIGIAGAYSMWLSYIGYAVFKADYTLNENGIYAKYLFKKCELIPWSEFQQVCVCYGDYSHKIRGAFAYICFVKHGVKKNRYNRWPIHRKTLYKKIITMDYTDKLLAEVRSKCPYKVPDLRWTGTYRL